MKVNDWLRKNTQQLEKAGIGTARVDCLVLLEDATGKNRAYLLAHPETTLQGRTLQRLEKQVEQREKHIPLAQIRGKTEFYGREFIINQDVLEPRPESEAMIDLLKGLYKNHAIASNLYMIADIGTGSGAIGITMKLEIPEAEVILTDIDPACLDVARKNAQKHNVEVTLFETDLLMPIKDSPLLHSTFSNDRWKKYYDIQLNVILDVILANLPYVPDSYEINRAALNEPKIAIFGGTDGLDLYRRLFKQLIHSTFSNDRWKKYYGGVRFVLTESLPFQHKELEKIANEAGYKQVQVDDFIQVFEKN